MNEDQIQELKYQLLQVCNGDVVQAQCAYDWIYATKHQ